MFSCYEDVMFIFVFYLRYHTFHCYHTSHCYRTFLHVTILLPVTIILPVTMPIVTITIPLHSNILVLIPLLPATTLSTRAIVGLPPNHHTFIPIAMLLNYVSILLTNFLFYSSSLFSSFSAQSSSSPSLFSYVYSPPYFHTFPPNKINVSPYVCILRYTSFPYHKHATLKLSLLCPKIEIKA